MIISFLFIFQLLINSDCSKDNKWAHQFKEPFLKVAKSIIEDISKGSKCMVFVLDPIYHNLIHYNWKSRGKTPSYTIRIRENEEFTPPRRKVNASLIASKNAACDTYIIFIANGYQVNEFLQHAERERLLKTQGSFLLIYDSRLFNLKMKYIWNRITNVIFINRFDALKTRSGQRISNQWFNIETVHYPVNVNVSVKTHYVDTWHKEKFRYGRNYFIKKSEGLKNLRKKGLKVAIFEHIPAVTKYSRMFYKNDQNNGDKALGIEFEILRIIAKKLNFKPIFYRPKDVETLKWGASDANGSYNGLLGEAVEGKAAFLLGDIYYTLRHNQLLELSYPYNTECLTFLTPEALTENSWKLLIIPFRSYTWIAVIMTLFFVSYTFRLFALCYENKILPFKQMLTNNETSSTIANEKIEGLELFTEVQNSILYTYSTLLQVSLPRLPEVWALRVFIGWWWLYCILITVSYRASLTASLANPIGRITINTFTELANSPIAVGGWGEDKKDPFILSSDVELNKIGENFVLINDEEVAIAKVANGTFSYYESIYVLKEARAKRQLLEDLEKQKAMKQNEDLIIDKDLHIMDECVIHVPISIGMDKNSPLKFEVDKIVRNIVESGFVEKWLSDVMEWSKIAEIKAESDGPKALVNLKKLYGAFVALAIGYFLGLIALIGEILHWKYVVMRSPDFDKYQMDVFYEKKQKSKKTVI